MLSFGSAVDVCCALDGRGHLRRLLVGGGVASWAFATLSVREAGLAIDVAALRLSIAERAILGALAYDGCQGVWSAGGRGTHAALVGDA